MTDEFITPQEAVKLLAALQNVIDRLDEVERRLEFYEGHSHSTHIGGMSGLVIGGPVPRRDI